jgi:hypothetical protein
MQDLKDKIAQIVMSACADWRRPAIGIAFQRVLAVAIRSGWKTTDDLDEDIVRSRIRLEVRHYFHEEKKNRLRQVKETD